MSPTPAQLNALIVEDSPNDAELLAKKLGAAGFDLHWTRVDTEADYLAGLKPQIDIIFSDFSLPHFSAPRALELLQESKLGAPFIIVSGTIGEVQAVECLKAGATDYVLKDHLDRVVPVVRRALREQQDRSERARLEAQSIDAQKMEMLGHLASGVAHDFNNILGVIIGYSNLMAPEQRPGSMSHKCAEEIRHAAERAASLTRQLLLFSRKETAQFVVLNVNQVVADMDKMLRRLVDESIALTVVPGKDVGRMKADAGQVGQVLMNLVVNARDAMPNGGKVTIATASVEVDAGSAIARAGAKPGDYVMLSVSDTGVGMNDSVKAHIFEAFFTTKPKGKGTGLGLSTCQTVLKQHGGYIDVQSEPGKGTTFKIYFPQVTLPLDVSCKSADNGPPPRGTETLLLVEDEPAVRNLACSILEAQGYNVLRASNGKEGLRVVREHKGAAVRLVITDVVMPQMSGKVMAEWLISMYPDMKILFTSGYTDDAIERHGMFDQGVAFLPKPYTPAALARHVRELLDEKSDLDTASP